MGSGTADIGNGGSGRPALSSSTSSSNSSLSSSTSLTASSSSPGGVRRSLRKPDGDAVTGSSGLSSNRGKLSQQQQQQRSNAKPPLAQPPSASASTRGGLRSSASSSSSASRQGSQQKVGRTANRKRKDGNAEYNDEVGEEDDDDDDDDGDRESDEDFVATADKDDDDEEEEADDAAMEDVSPKARDASGKRRTVGQQKGVVASDDSDQDDSSSSSSSNDEVCAVCQRHGTLVFCDGKVGGIACNLAVHIKCYVPGATLPAGDWLCDLCADGVRRESIRVVCCPSDNNALRRTTLPNAYIHGLCAKMNPLLNFDSGSDVLKLDNAMLAAGKPCAICANGDSVTSGTSKGLRVKCSKPDCGNEVHVTCARARLKRPPPNRIGRSVPEWIICGSHSRPGSGHLNKASGTVASASVAPAAHPPVSGGMTKKRKPDAADPLAEFKRRRADVLEKDEGSNRRDGREKSEGKDSLDRRPPRVGPSPLPNTHGVKRRESVEPTVSAKASAQPQSTESQVEVLTKLVASQTQLVQELRATLSAMQKQSQNQSGGAAPSSGPPPPPPPPPPTSSLSSSSSPSSQGHAQAQPPPKPSTAGSTLDALMDQASEFASRQQQERNAAAAAAQESEELRAVRLELRNAQTALATLRSDLVAIFGYLRLSANTPDEFRIDEYVSIIRTMVSRAERQQQ